jgi:hypothetical protein
MPHGVCDLPAGSVGEAERAAAAAALVPDEAPRVGCPDCGRQLARYRLYEVGLDLDACPTHGVWFDRDELPKLSKVGPGTRPKATLVARAGIVRAVPAAAAVAGATLMAGAAAVAATSPTTVSTASSVASAVGEVAVDAVVEVGFDLVGELISGIFS